MSKVKLNITDTRMLELIDALKEKGIITYRQEFCDVIDMEKQTIYNIKIAKQHFTAEHIMRACKEYKVNANWILGLEPEVFRPQRESREISRRMRRKVK